MRVRVRVREREGRTVERSSDATSSLVLVTFVIGMINLS